MGNTKENRYSFQTEVTLFLDFFAASEEEAIDKAQLWLYERDRILKSENLIIEEKLIAGRTVDAHNVKVMSGNNIKENNLVIGTLPD